MLNFKEVCSYDTMVSLSRISRFSFSFSLPVNIKLLEVFELTEEVRKLKASLKYMDLICKLLSDGSKRIIVV